MPNVAQPNDADSVIGTNWKTIKTWLDGSLAFTLLNGQQSGDFWMRNDVRRLVHHCYTHHPQIVNYATTVGWKLDYGFYLLHEHVKFKAVRAAESGFNLQCIGGRIPNVATKKVSEAAATTKERSNLRKEITTGLKNLSRSHQLVKLLRYVFCHSREWADLMHEVTPDQRLFLVRAIADFKAGGLLKGDVGVATAGPLESEYRIYSCHTPLMYGARTGSILEASFRHEKESCRWRILNN